MKKSLQKLNRISFLKPKVKVTFRIYAPQNTPQKDALFITGNHPKLGEWQPAAVPLHRKQNGVWEIGFEFPQSTSLCYKVTRGSWETEEVSRNGVPQGDRHLTARRNQIVVIRVANWRDKKFRIAGGITGELLYHKNFRSGLLKQKRTIVVWLPPSYRKDESKRYPVLYMHDGQNIFDPATAFGGVEWQVDETADKLIRQKKIREIIVVGIYNGPDRLEEYSDTEKGRAYMAFLVNELKPFIDKTYRTQPDHENTAIMGSSMGGLISLYLVWRYPHVFSMAGCLSPSLMWRKGAVLQMIRKEKYPPQKIKIYFDHGGIGDEGKYESHFTKLLKLLLQKGYKEGEEVLYYFDRKGDHSERSWSKRVWRPLTFMFGMEN